MTGALDVRLPGAGDRPALVAMVRTYLAEIAPDLEAPTQDRIAQYWNQDNRFAFVLFDGDLIGFALITRLTDGAHEVSEFYVAPKHRRAGLGRRFAADVVARFPGRWQLGLARGNPAAQDFWRAALTEHLVKRGPPLTPNQSGSLHFVVKEASQ